VDDSVSDQSSDDQLRELLRLRDPAASLAPVDPGRLAGLLEDTMSHDVETPTHDPSHPEADPRRRTPLTWLLAAAAVLVIAGVGVFALFGGEDQPTATTQSERTAPASVLQLSAPEQTLGRCAMVTERLLARQTVAFDGTVTRMDGGTVTLEVNRWYRGGDADLVTVEAPDARLQALILAVRFEAGERYLVTASNGEVTVCGFSAPYSDALAALYAGAFGS
jgi:hypothetical protein